MSIFDVFGIWPCKMNHVSMYSGRGLFVKYVVLYSWEVCISHSCTQYMCWLIIRKDIYVLLTESTSAGVIWVGNEICRSKDSKLQNIFLNPPLSSKQSKEISTGPTKPGQIRTTRSSKLITRSEADMASVEGNWVILYRWVIAGELWQCWFWTTQEQFLILLLLQPLSQLDN